MKNRITKSELLNICFFLREYERLCLEYNLSIEGCGCCGSPFLKYLALGDIHIKNGELKFDAYFNGKKFYNLRELEKYVDLFDEEK